MANWSTREPSPGVRKRIANCHSRCA
jgi:hypothetical protein